MSKEFSRVFFDGGDTRRPQLPGTFVEGLLVDAIFAHIRMNNARFTAGRGTRHETEWEIYTDVSARFLGVDVTELRDKLIEEQERCRDIRLCSDRIRFWAYNRMRPWR